MDLATLIGGVVGFGLVLVVMLASGSLLMYWDFLSLVIVLGGAICTSMMRWPLSSFIGGVSVSMGALFNRVEDPTALIDKIEDLANITRKNSLLALEKEQIDDPFLAKGIKLAVDGADVEVIDDLMASEVNLLGQRLADGRGILEDMAEAAPAMGMIGTVIGLIVIMANLSDPSRIGPGLAVALVTTLYGALIANMVFTPIAKKLKYRSKAEVRNWELIRVGVVNIIKGENPRLIRERLEAYTRE